MNEVARPGAITTEQLAILKSSEWFEGLDHAFQRAVLESSRVVVVTGGSSVFLRGDANDGIYCVLSGAVRFGAVAASGKAALVALVEGPEWFGEIALFDEGGRTHDAWAESTATLLHLPLRHLTRMLTHDPGRWRHLGALLVRKLRVALSLLEDMALEPPRVRLARCLVHLLEGYGQRPGDLTDRLRVSQERLGMLLALSRQTVNELLGELERESIIQCQRGGVRILDHARLRAMAQPSS
jgi:CRP/FNR family transcriptional regulator, cyclic AMP receptor protein